jgi:hypothetical protein
MPRYYRNGDDHDDDDDDDDNSATSLGVLERVAGSANWVESVLLRAFYYAYRD